MSAITTGQDLVADFRRANRLPIGSTPQLIPMDEARLHVKLLREEVDELEAAIEAGDVVEIADAYADIIYVAFGGAENHGIDLDPVFIAVHASNMSKLDENLQPVPHPTIPGKIGKSHLYEPPTARIRDILIRQGADL